MTKGLTPKQRQQEAIERLKARHEQERLKFNVASLNMEMAAHRLAVAEKKLEGMSNAKA